MLNNGVRSFRGKARAPVDYVFAARRWQGYDDAANHRSFAKEYDTWPAQEQKAYERGRQQAVLIRLNYGMVPKWKRTAKMKTAWQNVPEDMAKSIYRETHIASEFWAK